MECLLEHDSKVSHLCCVSCTSYRRFLPLGKRDRMQYLKGRKERDTENIELSESCKEREYGISVCALHGPWNVEQ